MGGVTALAWKRLVSRRLTWLWPELSPLLKQGRLRNVSQLCTQEEEVDRFRRPASCLLCAEAEFQAELPQMRDPELTLGGASAYDSDWEGRGGKSCTDTQRVTSTALFLVAAAAVSHFEFLLQSLAQLDFHLLPLLSSWACSQSVWPQAHSLSLLLGPTKEFPGPLFTGLPGFQLKRPVSPLLFLLKWTTAPGLWALVLMPHPRLLPIMVSPWLWPIRSPLLVPSPPPDPPPAWLLVWEVVPFTLEDTQLFLPPNSRLHLC